MSRYRVRLVPSGAIPRPLELGVRMSRKGAGECPECPEPPCVNTWEGWGVTVDDESVTNTTPVRFQNDTPDPVAIRVELVGELCPDACIAWELRAIADGSDVLYDDVSVTPDGCDAVDIAFTHDDVSRYAAFFCMLLATIDGVPFGEPIVFAAGLDATCIETRDAWAFDTWMAAIDGGDPPSLNTIALGAPPSTVPNSAFVFDYSDVGFLSGQPDQCGGELSAAIFLSGGDPDAYSDFTAAPWSGFSTGDLGVRIIATGAHDYTGISIEVHTRWTDTFTEYGPSFTIFIA